MFAGWGAIVGRLRWLVVVLTVAFAVFAGVWGTGAFGKLSGSATLDDPKSDSQIVKERIVTDFGRTESADVVGLYSSTTLAATDPAFQSAVTAVEARVRANPSVAGVTSYYDTHSPSMLSTDGHSTFISVNLVDGVSDSNAKKVRHSLAADGLTTLVGGQKVVDLDVGSKVGDGIAMAESISMPILTLLLILVFGNLVAALMPPLIGGLAVLGAFTAIRVIEQYTTVSTFAISIVTILGLGLAVDYGLFIVTRFREELDAGQEVRPALARTMATAGRTVAVSGLLVALALSSLLIYPQVFLRSMGFGGAAAVLVAMIASLTVLPALLAILGRRVDALALPWARRRKLRTGSVAPADPDSGRWAKIAGSVMRRPVVYLVAVLVVLGVLAAPVLNVHFGGVDERMLPAGTQSRVVSEKLASDFPGGDIRPIRVLISGVSPDATKPYQQQLAAVPGVTGTSVQVSNSSATLLQATFAGDASSVANQDLVKRVRALPAPSGATILVGGTTAGIVDQLHSVSSRLLWMGLIVAGLTFLFLAVAFGSVLVPIKAILMNAVSIGAAFGVVTWIFQEGHLSGFFDFTPTGYVEASQPVLMIAILFGLSMDYEVFLLSRIRERWDDLGDNRAAVVSGVQSTGKIITTAAALLCIVVGAFSMADVTFIKMIGVGMFVALLVDATVVRLLLVPATMRLLGSANWWAPGFLRALYGRYGVREGDARSGGPVPANASQEPAR
ncbi:putative membrane protein YdfJ with MMPL/SSD domain [Catenulispora sp. GAS73]|uniref:MMPL family transporter n=1 Tax=Catenulispora sp. GAS73 TaxID=3156269 RepID=UPI003515D5BF